jgi:hypothetical protein
MGEMTDGACITEEGCAWLTTFTTKEGESEDENESDTGMGTALLGRDVEARGLSIGADSAGADVIYVTGVTSGTLSGAAVDSDGTGTVDTFVAALNPATGSIIATWRSAESAGDVYASSVCARDDGTVAVVGWQEDTEEGVREGFVKLLTLSGSTITETWSVTLESEEPDDTVATDCAAVGDKVLLVGNTLGVMSFAATTPEEGQNRGGVDVWTAAVSAEDGEVLWGSQTGTTNDDLVGSDRGGWGKRQGGIVANKKIGIGYVLGTTRGSLVDENAGNSDVFVLSMTAEEGKTKLTADGGTWEGLNNLVVDDGGGEGPVVAGEGVQFEWWHLVVALVGATAIFGVAYKAGVQKTENKYNKLMTEIVPGKGGGMDTGRMSIGDEEL